MNHYLFVGFRGSSQWAISKRSLTSIIESLQSGKVLHRA